MKNIIGIPALVALVVSGLLVGAGCSAAPQESEPSADGTKADETKTESISQASTGARWARVRWATAGLYSGEALDHCWGNWGTVYAGQWVYLSGQGTNRCDGYTYDYVLGYGRQAWIRADAHD